MHTVIIGNGIIGLTTAFRLARRAGSKDRVTLIGKKIRPGSATLAAGAMLNSFAEIENRLKVVALLNSRNFKTIKR